MAEELLLVLEQVLEQEPVLGQRVVQQALALGPVLGQERLQERQSRRHSQELQ